ncbi:MAG TPA: sigma-54 dependent transcriptional regulator [Lacipirellulaceae bacterium]|nr:sigma-54 dependent transcriptional regulator [Lacipirellulaceae bacterium]
MKPTKPNGGLGRVLVVDDHAAARASVIDVLECAGYAVQGRASAVEAEAALDALSFDVVITDLQMPGMDGLEFIRRLARRKAPTQAIMITAHATIASAVEAMRLGAFDYLEKPFDVGSLERVVARAMERGQVCGLERTGSGAAGAEALRAAIQGDDLGMVGASQAMAQLRARIRQVGPTDETVLISGESGVGKELVARAIHAVSRRADRPLVSLNCPALSPQLAESELFGHRRGAFTGAEADRVGRFESAAGGTICLAEITEIDLPLQAKLLRVLQERTFEPVGSSDTRRVDVRIIASTNRDLPAEIAAGRFRADLYYRLAVVPLEPPPLRARDSDVLTLADYFLDRAAQRLQRPRVDLAADARELLCAYRWPGNVRELENLITRACVLSLGAAISAADIRPWLQQPDAVSQLPEPGRLHSGTALRGAAPALAGARLEELERATIVATLKKFGGNRAQTAAALGIGVRTLSGKMRAYGFAPRTRDFDERQELPQAPAETAGTFARQSA